MILTTTRQGPHAVAPRVGVRVGGTPTRGGCFYFVDTRIKSLASSGTAKRMVSAARDSNEMGPMCMHLTVPDLSGGLQFQADVRRVEATSVIPRAVNSSMMFPT